MFRNYFQIFLFSVLFLVINLPLSAQNSAPKSGDYKKWTLEQLIFTIDSGLLDEETRLDYIEFYLQKAKKENAIQDIVTGYEKKAANLKDYDGKSLYADSLVELAHKLNDNKILGTAYYTKGYVESTKYNYTKSLDYLLKAKEYLENTDDLYTLNKVKAIIAYNYYHNEDYDKSYKLRKEVTKYYSEDKNNSYNSRKRYIISLLNLSVTAYHFQKYDTLQLLINEGYAEIPRLKTHHQPLETAYFSLVEGKYNHVLKNYQKSDSLLQSALPIIKKNNDPTNEHIGYMFLGKNAWEQNQKEKALGYFLKTDSLYQNKKIITVELCEAYTYIIEYYKEQNNTEQQLYYTNVLLQISDELKIRNKNLTNRLQNIDFKQQETKKTNYNKFIVVITVVFIIAVVFFVIKRKKSSKQQAPVNNGNGNDNDYKKESKPKPEIPDTVHTVMQKLAKFEEDKGFTEKITLDDLAKQLKTNRTTLSKIINEYKDTNFNGYINKLRIDNAMQEIRNNPQYKELKIEVLAEKFGFGNAKSFSDAFKEVTDMPLNDFISSSKKN